MSALATVSVRIDGTCPESGHWHRNDHISSMLISEETIEMKRTVILGTTVALWAGPILAQSTVSTSEFVKRVAISDMLEIQSSQLVAPNADADTKPFAEKMVNDHSQTSNELKALVQSAKVKAELPTTLDPEHQKKLDELKRLGGKDLDKAYDQMQLQAHQEAVELFTKYSQTGDNAELKQWAAKVLPHLKEHLSMAQQLKF
jgi:putative membrane protein